MANITIKNIPDELYEQLKHSASVHRRSINSEAIVCLERALKFGPHDEDALMARIRQLRSLFPVHMSENQRRAAVEEGRT